MQIVTINRATSLATTVSPPASRASRKMIIEVVDDMANLLGGSATGGKRYHVRHLTPSNEPSPSDRVTAARSSR
jgi:hypothetical protein